MRRTIDDLVRPSIKNLVPYSSARDEFKDFNRDLIFLDANENPFPSGLNRYPDPDQSALKAKLSEIKGISSENILLGNGSDEILDLLVRGFCEPGEDAILVMPPTYGMYKVISGINNVELIEVPLRPDFQPDLKKVVSRLESKVKMIMLCSPNNPSGNRISDAAIESLLNVFDGLVVVDEAYIDFSTGGSWVKKLSGYPNLVITQTFSKAYGMAGIRIGIAVASLEIIRILRAIKPPYNVNSLSAKAAIDRLEKQAEVKKEVADILHEREKLEQALDHISFVKEVFPSDANFLLVRVDDAGRRYEELTSNGIVVRNRSNQMHCDNCLRFTIGTAEENRKLIATLKELK